MNVWENAVGLYHGANMSLLRTVIDVHLQLSDVKKPSKTVLLFVVRDYAGKTPTANLCNILLDDLQRIWSSLEKTNRCDERATLDDYFCIRFAFLPHKVLQTAEFGLQMSLLRERFLDPLSEGYVFDDGTDVTIGVGDIPVFASNIWARIESNKDLDLPTERELLAQYRCDEISRNISSHFNGEIKGIRRTIEQVGGVFTPFGETFHNLLKHCKSEFVLQSSHYSNTIAGQKLQDLMEMLSGIVQDLAERQLDNAIKSALRDFDVCMRQQSKGAFIDRIKSSARISTESFERCLSDCEFGMLRIDGEYSRGNFESALDTRIQAIKGEEAVGCMLGLEKKVSRSLQLLRQKSFGMGATESFWESFWQLMEASSEALQAFLEGTRKGKFDRPACTHPSLEIHLMGL